MADEPETTEETTTPEAPITDTSISDYMKELGVDMQEDGTFNPVIPSNKEIPTKPEPDVTEEVETPQPEPQPQPTEEVVETPQPAEAETPGEDPKPQTTTDLWDALGSTDNKADVRDYSRFEASDAEILRKLPNREFNYFKERLVALYEAANAAKPQASAEDAYTLSPEYKAAVDEYNVASTLSEAAKQELISLKSGNGFRPIVGFDTKTGQVQYGARQDDASPADELNLSHIYNSSVQAIERAKTTAAQVQQSYSQTWNGATSAVKETIASYAPWVTNEKLQDHTINVQGKPAKIRELIDNTRQRVPNLFRNHPMTDAFVHTYLYLLASTDKSQRLEKEVAELKKKLGQSPSTEMASAKKTQQPASKVSTDSINQAMRQMGLNPSEFGIH